MWPFFKFEKNILVLNFHLLYRSVQNFQRNPKFKQASLGSSLAKSNKGESGSLGGTLVDSLTDGGDSRADSNTLTESNESSLSLTEKCPSWSQVRTPF